MRSWAAESAGNSRCSAGVPEQVELSAEAHTAAGQGDFWRKVEDRTLGWVGGWGVRARRTAARMQKGDGYGTQHEAIPLALSLRAGR
jgi:hypothetical protein